MANPETLTCIFHEEDPVPAPKRSSDDPPHHVKGIAHWYAEAKPTAGYYIPKKYSPTKEFEPIEFLNNQWYGLFKDESIPDTLCTHAIAAIPIKNNLGLRYWDISEPQHPCYMPNPQTPITINPPEDNNVSSLSTTTTHVTSVITSVAMA